MRLRYVNHSNNRANPLAAAAAAGAVLLWMLLSGCDSWPWPQVFSFERGRECIEPNDTVSAGCAVRLVPQVESEPSAVAEHAPAGGHMLEAEKSPESLSSEQGQAVAVAEEPEIGNSVGELAAAILPQPVPAPNQPRVVDDQSQRQAISQSQPELAESPASILRIPALEQPGMADELVTLNFDQVEIRTVLKTIGEITGINFVIDENVRGTVTVMSPSRIRLAEIYSFLESILEVQGYAAIPAGNLVKVVPKAEATKSNLQVRIGSDPASIPENDTIVTQIIPLKYADAEEISQIIRPLLSAEAEMAAYPRTNSIVITDTSSNIHHIATVIERLDVPGAQEKVTVIGLKYASAQVLGEQIKQIMDRMDFRSTAPVGGRGGTTTSNRVRILPDVRTNSLVVVANADDTETIKSLVEQLDKQRPTGASNVHVVYLKNAEAKTVADSLTKALAGLKISGAIEATQQVHVTADEGTNALIISASAQDFAVIKQIVDKLDVVREQVLVEMLIVEVSEDSLKEIGVDWATLDQAVDGSARFFGATNFGPRVNFASGDLEGLAIGTWRGAGSNRRIGSMIHALQKQTGVNILSTPHIMTSNHHKAKIVVGENRPFVVESRITETTDFITPTVIKTYEYKDVGISLEITPHISQGGLIRLEINSEFTKLIESSSSTTTDTPTTAKRQAQTVVSMNSGSTVVIGGLIRDDKVTVEKKVPLLGDLPGIGGLFRLQKDQLQKTNLLIFITPHIMGNQADMERLTEQKKQQMGPVLKQFVPDKQSAEQ